MPKRGYSELRRCEGKIEGRTSPRAAGLCLHIGLSGATASSGRAAIGLYPLSAFGVSRGSPAQVPWSSRGPRS
jgi:hypothetical protein